MKKLFILAALALFCAGVSAQEEKKETPKGYAFATVDSLPITPVKDQAQSGTCWSFSSIGFFESELLRLGKGEHDLAEMFVVHKTMGQEVEQLYETGCTSCPCAGPSGKHQARFLA